MIRLSLGVVCCAFLGILVQGSFLPAMIPAYLIPNFLLILVVFISFYEVSVLGVVLSFVTGLLFDFSSGILLGPWSGSFVVVYALLALFARRLFIQSLSTVVISVFLANGVATALYLALLYQFQPIRGGLFSASLVESLLSALFAPLVFVFYRIVLIGKSERSGSRVASGEGFSLLRSER